MNWLPLLIALMAGIVGVADKLINPDKKIRTIGVACIVVLVISIGWQAYNDYKRQLTIERLRVFTHSRLEDIDEASGGTIDPDRNRAYIVDDDEAKVFEFAFNEVHRRYDRRGEILLRDKSGNPLTNKTLEDLEAAAYHAGKLYLITSHSNKISGVEKPKRQLLLEVSLEEGCRGNILRQSTNLRRAILDRFSHPVSGRDSPLVGNGSDEEERREVMNIEGLTISEQGRAYLGFRSPIVDGKYAVVLQADIDQLFSQKPEFRVILLHLLHEGKDYAITDIALDIGKKDILILANSRKRLEFFSPTLWRWTPTDNEGLQEVYLTKAGFMLPPEHFRAKPEVLLVGENRIDIFADAEGYGGQRSYFRSEMGLR